MEPNGKQAGDAAAPNAAALREQLEALVSSLEKLARIEGNEALKVALQGRGTLEKAVREQPLAALGLAAAAGFLLALLVRR
jgi:ElaB/YqjD/DUF883 family membrane-anchored ribosome-binding protein